MRIRFTTATAISLLVAVLVSLVGCGPTPQATQPATETKPTRLVYALRADPVTLDPGKAIGAPESAVMGNIYNALFNLNEKGELVPDLCERFSVSEDDLTWTFHLRQGVKFHDGTEFDAHAAKFVYDRFFDDSLNLAHSRRWKGYVAGPEDIVVLDKYTLQIKTVAPSPFFQYIVARGFPGWIPSPEAIKKYGEDLGRNPVGTGPFKFDSWVSGEKVVVSKNDDYHFGAPAIDQIEMRVISDDSARVMALESGEVHLISNVPPAAIPTLEGNANISVVKSPLYRVFYWAFNMTKPYFQDVRVRQAFNYAIDREALVKHVLQGVGTVADSYLAPTVEGYRAIGLYKYDPDKARQLLQEAGWDSNLRLTTYVTQGRYYQDRESAEAVAGMLDAVGVKVQIRVLEWGAFTDAIWNAGPDDPAAQQRDFVQTTWGTNNVAYGLQAVFHGDSFPPTFYNEAFFANEEVDRLLDAIDGEMDREKRLALIGEVQQLLMENAPWIHGYVETQVFAMSKNLEGVKIFTETVFLEEATLKK